MKKVIILNGPPGCGKDTIARVLEEIGGFDIHSFKKPMFDIAETMLGPVKFKQFMKLYNDRDTKEMPCDLLGQMSPREFFIHISESFVKPILGNEQFGYLAASGAIEATSHVVFSDGGFPDEVRALIEHEQSDYHLYLVRLHREGFTFEGDSRNYVNLFEEYRGYDRYTEIDFHLTNGNAYDDANDIMDLVYE
ncbi:hypothetical protein RCIP0073_00038 [Klebsiella phage RCIP0073]|nr:hypothetical protein KL3_00040 [Klebsiella phage KL3]UPU15864.1 dNMP kinase [Klebsiella phage vB_KpnS_SXFY507]